MKRNLVQYFILSNILIFSLISGTFLNVNTIFKLREAETTKSELRNSNGRCYKSIGCPCNFSDIFQKLNLSINNLPTEDFDIPELDIVSLDNNEFEQFLLNDNQLQDLLNYSIELGYVNCLGKFIMNNSVFLGIRANMDNSTFIFIFSTFSSCCGSKNFIMKVEDNSLFLFDRHVGYKLQYQNSQDSGQNLIEIALSVYKNSTAEDIAEFIRCILLEMLMPGIWGFGCTAAIVACILSGGVACPIAAVYCAAWIVVAIIICMFYEAAGEHPWEEEPEGEILTATSSHDFGSASVITVTENEAITFDASNSNDPNDFSYEFEDGTVEYYDIVSYHWDFGDGTESNEKICSHTYSNEGTYYATLTITDGFGYTDSKTITINVDDDDIVAPEIIINYLDGDYTDGHPGIWNVQISDPKGLSYIEIRIDDVLIEQMDNIPSFNKDYNIPNSLGEHLINITASDNDNTPSTITQPSSLTIVDDDTTPPELSTLIINHDIHYVNISLNAIDQSGIKNILILVNGEKIEPIHQIKYENMYGFVLKNEWILKRGIYEVEIQATDTDNDRPNDALTSSIFNTFEIYLGEMYEYVDWQLEELKIYIEDSLSYGFSRCLNWKLTRAQIRLHEAFALVKNGDITCGLYNNLIAKICVRFSEIKTEVLNKLNKINDEIAEYIINTLHNIRNNIVILMGSSIGEDFAYDIALIEIDLLNLCDFIDEEIPCGVGRYLSSKVWCASKMLEIVLFKISMDEDIEYILRCTQCKLEKTVCKINHFLEKDKISEDIANYLNEEITRIIEAIELVKID